MLYRTAFSLICMLLLTTGCNQSSDSSRAIAKTSILRVGYIGATKIPVGPFGWAMKRGILARGLPAKVTLAQFGNGPDLNEALVAGQLDLGIYGDTPAIILRARGFKTRLIRINQFNSNAWLVTKKNGPRSVAELKGQIVATQKGSYMHRYLLGLLDAAGIAKETKVIHLASRDAQSALERGDIAAYAAPDELGALLKSQGYPVIDEAIHHPGLAGTSVIVSTDNFLAQQPDIPQKLNQVLAAAIKDIKAHSQDYYKFNAQITGYPIAVVKVSYTLNQLSENPFPEPGLQLLEGTKKFLVSQGLAKSDFKLANWVFDKPKGQSD